MIESILKPPPPIVVELTRRELLRAGQIGMQRWEDSLARGLSDVCGATRDTMAENWFKNVVGAMGEQAAARCMGRYWPASVGARKSEPDILPDIQVRCLRGDDFDLIVRANDIPEHRYVLVTGNPPAFTVRGWIRGLDAMRDEWWRDRGGRQSPCWWVPQSSLRDIRELCTVEVSP